MNSGKRNSGQSVGKYGGNPAKKVKPSGVNFQKISHI